MRRGAVRLLLLLDVIAIAAIAFVAVVVPGLPLAAHGRLSPAALIMLGGGAAVAAAGVGAVLLLRAVARPVERLLVAAERLGADAGLPLLGPDGDRGGDALGRAAIAFERLAGAHADERARLAAKVVELERANAKLAAARASLLASERLATVGRLAAGIAHEVGNPLGAVAGYAELARDRLRSGGRVAEADDFVARIGAEAARIDAIVRDLLDFARPAPVQLGAVEVAPVVDAALRLARVQPRFKAVEVTLALPPDLPPVRADARRLGQVLLNLLLNAGDAMEGGGAVRVSARAGDGAVELSVSDRGPGIAPADLVRVFDPFFTTKAPGRGTGLGLSVCLGIVESLGGTITAENAPEGGARFRVRLLGAAPPVAPHGAC